MYCAFPFNKGSPVWTLYLIYISYFLSRKRNNLLIILYEAHICDFYCLTLLVLCSHILYTVLKMFKIVMQNHPRAQHFCGRLSVILQSVILLNFIAPLNLRNCLPIRLLVVAFSFHPNFNSQGEKQLAGCHSENNNT